MQQMNAFTGVMADKTKRLRDFFQITLDTAPVFNQQLRQIERKTKERKGSVFI